MQIQVLITPDLSVKTPDWEKNPTCLVPQSLFKPHFHPRVLRTAKTALQTIILAAALHWCLSTPKRAWAGEAQGLRPALPWEPLQSLHPKHNKHTAIAAFDGIWRPRQRRRFAVGDSSHTAEARPKDWQTPGATASPRQEPKGHPPAKRQVLDLASTPGRASTFYPTVV